MLHRDVKFTTMIHSIINNIFIIENISEDFVDMFDYYKILLILITTVVLSFMITPIIKKAAFKIGAYDEPDKRRVNKKVMPTAGGIAIYISYFLSLFFLFPISNSRIIPIFIGVTIIIIVGLIDDIKEISAKYKMLGIFIAGLVIYYMAEINMSKIVFPFLGEVELGFWGLPITLFWILGITNSVNLIDGLDGLAAGVSSISLLTMGIISFFFLGSGSSEVAILIFALVAAIIGFLPFNFYPASIYLGDTGSLFLGFMISILSLYGLKNVTLISFIIPIVILGVPIIDTFFAIVRRVLAKQPISMADKNHMHHRLMSLGFTHKQTVQLIYAMSFVFSCVALLYPQSSTVGAVIITVILIFILSLFTEIIELSGKGKKPLINLIKKISGKD